MPKKRRKETPPPSADADGFIYAQDFPPDE